MIIVSTLFKSIYYEFINFSFKTSILNITCPLSKNSWQYGVTILTTPSFCFKRKTSFHKFILFFNRLSKGRGYTVRLYVYFINVCSPIFFWRMLWFWYFVVAVAVGKISASWSFSSKNFLNRQVLNLSICLFNILFGYNFFKNEIIAKKFWYAFETHRFALH